MEGAPARPSLAAPLPRTEKTVVPVPCFGLAAVARGHFLALLIMEILLQCPPNACLQLPVQNARLSLAVVADILIYICTRLMARATQLVGENDN